MAQLSYLVQELSFSSSLLHFPILAFGWDGGISALLQREMTDFFSPFIRVGRRGALAGEASASSEKWIQISSPLWETESGMSALLNKLLWALVETTESGQTPGLRGCPQDAANIKYKCSNVSKKRSSLCPCSK